jgi:hypothetical protein
MKLSIAIEIADDEPRFDIIPPAPERRAPQRPALPVSANFMAQLAASFLGDYDVESRTGFESRGIARSYEAAAALAPPSPDTVIRRKI